MFAFTKRATLFAYVFLSTCTVLANAQSLPSTDYGLPELKAKAQSKVDAVDIGKALNNYPSTKNTALRYALDRPLQLELGAQAKTLSGEWQELPGGLSLWRLNIHAPHALSMDLGFKHFFLPQQAELFIANADKTVVYGPFTDADNPKTKEFWTPAVPGDLIRLELLLPTRLKNFARLELAMAHAGFRDIWTGLHPQEKSGSCNVDAICPQGDAIRDPIRAVARYTVSGSLCTGQLLNNTRGDHRRLFSTAHHCFSSQEDAGSVVLYWRYESPVCRTVGSGQNAQVLPTSAAIVQTGGATLLATHEDSDFTLVELNAAVPGNADAYWDGWDRSETAPGSARVAHHANGDEKRLAFENNALTASNVAVSGVPGSRHWRIADWDLGTTEPGSSGAGLLNPQNRVIGFLSGGSAACGNDLEDYFGRLNSAWEGGGNNASRLRDWLNPTGSTATGLDGISACQAPTVALSSNAPTADAGATVRFTADITGQGPFTVSWDMDADGTFDRIATQVAASTSLEAQYPTATSTTVSVRVTDATGCSAQAQRAINIVAPDIVLTAQAPQQVCGDGDQAMEPGEEWRVPVSLFNSGGKAMVDGYAVFASDAVDAATRIDGFGYQYRDDDSGQCAFQAVPLSASASPLPLASASASFPAADDGHTAPLELAAAANFYGQAVSSLVMSTNGYLSTASAETGGDYENQCGLDGDAQGGRLHVLHDDLRVGPGGGLYRETFPVCPRPRTPAARRKPARYSLGRTCSASSKIPTARKPKAISAFRPSSTPITKSSTSI